MKLRRFIPVLIIAAGVWAYHNSFQGPFIFDDVPSIRHESAHPSLVWPLAGPWLSSPNLPVQGRPVECLTLALNYAFGGLDVWGYHAFNLMLHLVSALVLFGLLRRTFAGGKLRDRFGNGGHRYGGGDRPHLGGASSANGKRHLHRPTLGIADGPVFAADVVLYAARFPVGARAARGIWPLSSRAHWVWEARR